MNQWKGKTKNELEMFSSPVIDIDDSWFLWSLCFTVLPNKIPDFGNLNNKDGYQAHSVPLGVGYDSVGRPGISQNASWTRSRPKWRTYPNRLCSSNLGLVLHCIVLFTLHCFVPGFRSRLQICCARFLVAKDMKFWKCYRFFSSHRRPGGIGRTHHGYACRGNKHSRWA